MQKTFPSIQIILEGFKQGSLLFTYLPLNLLQIKMFILVTMLVNTCHFLVYKTTFQKHALIIPEKSNILLRYLHKKWEKENPDRKRELNDGETTSQTLKRPRFDDSDDSS